MKRIAGLLVLAVLFLTSCFGGTTYHVKNDSPNPGGEAYKYFLVQNHSPYSIKIMPGFNNYILDPGTEIVLKRRRPVLGSRFGRFSFMAYAYREFRGGRLGEFIGQQEVWGYLDGKVFIFEGRVFADRIEFGEYGWYLPPSGFPSEAQGNFLGIIPWKFTFKHSRPR